MKELAETITESVKVFMIKQKRLNATLEEMGLFMINRMSQFRRQDEDYVDQFLFDTKRGYCDNFSTSMVVMLRSIGIPARWVKGFAPGEMSEMMTGESVYQITNNEAHSWVEAYMPGIGWMPFEPTIGFSGPDSIDYDIEMDLSDPEVPEMKEQEKERAERKNRQNRKEIRN